MSAVSVLNPPREELPIVRTDHVKWPKTPRLSAPWLITEKIDGSNSCVAISRLDSGGEPPSAADLDFPEHTGVRVVFTPDGVYALRAASRNRWLTTDPRSDNFGFAAWVHTNAEALAALGQGRHYGEWYGAGIQRTYGLQTRRWALFNERWRFNLPEGLAEIGVEVVPQLAVAEGGELVERVSWALDRLDQNGSVAVPGKRAEGVIITHLQDPTKKFKALGDEVAWMQVP
jgi:hypothetical protein